MLRRLAAAAREEGGSSIVEGLLALGLVLLVFALGAEALLYVQARTIAIAAAQAGARGAALGGEGAGLAAARAVLDAGGGLSVGLEASVVEQGGTVTASVQGSAPALFHAGILLPAISTAASAPLEAYPSDEQAVGP
jgi:hypothetical protein